MTSILLLTWKTTNSACAMTPPKGTLGSSHGGGCSTPSWPRTTELAFKSHPRRLYADIRLIRGAMPITLKTIITVLMIQMMTFHTHPEVQFQTEPPKSRLCNDSICKMAGIEKRPGALEKWWFEFGLCDVDVSCACGLSTLVRG